MISDDKLVKMHQHLLSQLQTLIFTFKHSNFLSGLSNFSETHLETCACLTRHVDDLQRPVRKLDRMSQQEETYDPFPRPGDADFTSFPKHVPEDTCIYQVYLISATLSGTTSVTGNAPGNSLAALQRLQRQVKELEKKHLGVDYIWHRESFRLELEEFTLPDAADSSALSKGPHAKEPSPSSTTRWRLAGRTSHGDSQADEWAIVFLLRELTRLAPDAWARIEDADGEFLLIEAAHALPRWVQPEVAAHRVWIHDGRLELVPSSLRPTEQLHTDGKITTKPQSKGSASKKREREVATPIALHDALHFIARHGDKEVGVDGGMVHSQLVEDEAFYRLRNHPQPAVQDTFHRARVLLPRTLAYVLRRCPQHISAAVESFYLRDPVAAKPLLLPEKNPAGLRFAVDDLVEMSVKFTRVGYAQVTSQEFGVPPAYVGSGFDGEKEQSDSKKSETGLKLTAGFEMLVSDPANASKRAVREITLLLEDLDAGEDTLPTDQEITDWSRVEDDEKWLDVDYADFEAELGGKGLRTAGSTNESSLNKTKAQEDVGSFGDKAAQENLRRIVERFEKFLNDDDAGPDGALFGDDDEDSDSDEDMASGEETGRAERGKKDKETLRQKAYLDRETLDSDDDMPDDDDYGGASEDDSGEDHEASFDEAEFEAMMRQMMGMPVDADVVDTSLTSLPTLSNHTSATSPSHDPSTSKDTPEATTRHQFSFADAHTTGAVPAREPTIRERIAALDLDSEPSSDPQSKPFLTAKAFQHWAAQQDTDFSDERDRTSYLKKQGLPVLDAQPTAKPTSNGKKQRTAPPDEQASKATRQVTDDGFVSLSAHPSPISRPSDLASKDKRKGNVRFATTPSEVANTDPSNPQDRVVELSSSDDEDNEDFLAPTSTAAQSRTPSRWVVDAHSDSDMDEDEDDPEAMQATMAAMQAELEATGFFARASGDTTTPAIEANSSSRNRGKGKGKGKGKSASADSDAVADENDPKYILAKNLLEAFKSGEGSGPAQSMLAALGMGMGALPRDGDESGDD